METSSSGNTLRLMQNALEEDIDLWTELERIQPKEKNVSSLAEQILRLNQDLKVLKKIIKQPEFNYTPDNASLLDGILKDVDQLREKVESFQKSVTWLKDEPLIDQSNIRKSLIKLSNIQNKLTIFRSDYQKLKTDDHAELDEEDFDFLPTKEEIRTEGKKLPHLSWRTDLQANSSFKSLEIDSVRLLEDIKKCNEGMKHLGHASKGSIYLIPDNFTKDLHRFNGMVINGKTWAFINPFQSQYGTKLDTETVYADMVKHLGDEGAQRAACFIYQSFVFTTTEKIMQDHFPERFPGNQGGLFFELKIDSYNLTIMCRQLFVLQDTTKEREEWEFILGKKTLVIPLESLRAKQFDFDHIPGLHVMEQITPILPSQNLAMEALFDYGVIKQLNQFVDYWKSVLDSISSNGALNVDGEGNPLMLSWFSFSSILSLNRSQSLDVFAERFHQKVNETSHLLEELPITPEICTVRRYEEAFQGINRLEKEIKSALEQLHPLLVTYSDLKNEEGYSIIATDIEVLEALLIKIPLVRSRLIAPPETYTFSANIPGDAEMVIKFVKAYQQNPRRITEQLEASEIFSNDLHRMGAVKINNKIYYERNPFLNRYLEKALEEYEIRNLRKAIFSQMVDLLGLFGAQRIGCLMHQGLIAHFLKDPQVIKMIMERFPKYTIVEGQGDDEYSLSVISSPLYTELFIGEMNVTVINKALLGFRSPNEEREPVVHHHAIAKQVITIPLNEITDMNFDIRGSNPIQGMSIVESFSEPFSADQQEKLLVLLRRF